MSVMARQARLEEARANLQSATRVQEIVEPINPNAVRILALCREHGMTMIGQAGIAVVDLVRRGFVTVTPSGANRWRVEATAEGFAAIADVKLSNQDHGAERHCKRLLAPPRHRPERRNWGAK